MKKRKHGARRAYHAFDLFCGAGGSSFGARAAGIRIAGGVELAPLAAQTYSKNFPEAEVFQKDIRCVSARSVARKIGKIDMLLASPECTNHTIAKGKRRKARSAQLSRMTAYAVTRFAKVLKPRWIVVENVIQMRKWSRYQHWLNRLVSLGYNVSPQVLDAADFGVRQTRRRLFIICDRKHAPQEVASTTARPKAVGPILNMNGAYEYSLLNSKKRAAPTLQRARRGIRAVGPGKAFLLVYYGSDGAGGWQRLGAPLRTITTLDRFALVKRIRGRYRMRMLQVPELKSAMGFPESFQMPFGSRRARIRMLGNGVCPPVMEVIVRTLMSEPAQDSARAASENKNVDLEREPISGRARAPRLRTR
jgi:DNA (cytosine-5)-methyltransferase 1